LHMYPMLEHKHGSLRCLQIGLQLVIPSFLALPFLSLLLAGADKSLGDLWLPAGSEGTWTMAIATHYAMWGLLVVLMLLRSAGSVFVTTSLNLLSVNLAPSKSDLGSMNGFQQMSNSITRFAGPVISGIVWSWSIKHTFPYPFNAHLLWVLCAALAAVSLKISTGIPESVNTFQAGQDAEESSIEEA
ncbi:hypothetical protein IWQ56_002016, partial [Coemansia nantahalensis]